MCVCVYKIYISISLQTLELFYILPIMNNAALNVQVPYMFLCGHVFLLSLGDIPRSGVAG